MLKTLYRIAAWLIVALGIIHVLFTAHDYDELTLDAMWFASAGLAIIFAGFLNLTLAADSGENRLGFVLCVVSNLMLTLLFAGAAVFMLRQPQVFVGASLFAFATIASFVLGRRRSALSMK